MEFTRGGLPVPTGQLERWVTFSRFGDAELVSLSGEIDLANAPEIGKAIVERIQKAGKVLIDLTTVSFLDSAGVRLLDALIGDLNEHGKPTRLVVGESGAARMTLQLCAFREDVLATDLDRAAAEIGG
ncbi:STAS domain-containing protein [Actinoplanes bogorensis]|uniref:STAS domain-containing protein n=1 Tax=Paractinoplanes bogorensis TaxID=1610840 RepID=A0ABS5Z1Z7_9ACTN|nr:STAS domain-containing protein [Actinoplanes bogorensis]MBU2669717.1 STAS domain-containing protein [Actinoplanes bogorensis]